MTTMLTGLVALLIAFIAVAFFLRARHSLITGGITGLVAGFMFGLFAAVLPGFTHYFGPVEIPNPVILLPWFATTLANFYPLIFGAVGLVVGIFVGARRRK